MSHSFADHGGDHRQPNNAASAQTGASRQFAQGGNGSTLMAQPGPADPMAGPDAPMRTAADSLVMLQLASFEGRAL